MKIIDSIQHKNVQGYYFAYHPFTKPSLGVYTYFVDGLLIDTAQSKMRKEVLKILSPLDIEQIAITHHHEDHTGNLSVLYPQFKVPVYASKKCIELMANPPKISFAQKMVWGDRSAFTHFTPYHRSIETNHYHFELIPVPGHAIDMYALYERKQGWLFAGDLYVNSFIGYFLKTENISQQIDSLRRVLQLDFDQLFCCHNPQMTKPKIQLQKKLDFLEEFKGKVLTLARKGYEADAIMKQLNLKEYWSIRLLSRGDLSRRNMVNAVIREMVDNG